MNIQKLTNCDNISSLENVTHLKVDIATYSWTGSHPQFDTDAKVHCLIAHTNTHLLLHYFVSAPEIRATYKEFCDPVWQDSCVEFFASFDKQHYYNFEFNSLGTCLAFYGNGRENRIQNEFLKNNKDALRFVSSVKEPLVSESASKWNLFVALDKRAFFKDETNIKKEHTKENVELFANLYACGDLQKKPFYLSAFKIGTQNPDFHQPSYFEKFTLLS